MSKLDDEWLEALEVEPTDAGVATDTGDDDQHTGSDETDKDDKGSDDGADGDANADKSTDEDTATDEDSKGDEDSDGVDEDKPDDDKPADEAAKQSETPAAVEPSTKEAVKEALQEIESSKAERISKVESFKAEVSKTLYPEGIDRTLRDSDGDPIKGIEDLTRLINPKTNELFTEEEAGAWLLSAQQKLNQEVQVVEKFIEDVAEVNVQIEEGADRVVKKYGEFLVKNPELKDRLLAGYNKTLIKDAKTGVTIKAPVDVVEFFDLTLEPILKQQAAAAEEAAKASKEAEERARKNRQTERGDLKPNGKTEMLPPEDKEWAEAFKAYEEGVK